MKHQKLFVFGLCVFDQNGKTGINDKTRKPIHYSVIHYNRDRQRPMTVSATPSQPARN